MLHATIAAITLMDGSRVELPVDGIVLIVGPNNAGKSLLLSEMFQQTTAQGYGVDVKWLSMLEMHKTGDDDELARWFAGRARQLPTSHPNAGSLTLSDVSMGAGPILLDDARRAWSSSRDVGVLWPWLVGYYDAMSRGHLLQSAPARDPMRPAQHPLHMLWDDRAAEGRLSRLVERAFGSRCVSIDTAKRSNC